MALECVLLFGKVPAALKGRLYRNGPSCFDPLARHFLDGDGHVDMVEFPGGGEAPRALSKPVRLPNDPTLGRVFATASVGGRLKNLANTALALHGGSLLATYEGGLPHDLDPNTLQTRGLHTLGGAVRMGPPIVGSGHAVCAHSRRVGKTLACMATQFSPSGTHLRFMEMGEHWNIISENHTSLPYFSLVHDFGVTDNYFVALSARLNFSPVGFLLGKRTAAESVTHTEGPSELLLVPRNTNAKEIRIPTPRCLATHVANCWEEDGCLVADVVVATPTASLASTAVPPCTLHRFIVSLEDETLITRVQLFSHVADFPRVNPHLEGRKASRFTYLVTRDSKEGTCWVKLDSVTGRARASQALPGALHGEACFVPYGEREDAGWLVGLIAFRGKAAIAVVDARNMSPVCALEAPQCNTLGLHCLWSN